MRSSRRASARFSSIDQPRIGGPTPRGAPRQLITGWRDWVERLVSVMVRSDNEAAIRLYRKAGFEQLAVLERDTKIGDSDRDGILMWKFVRN